MDREGQGLEINKLRKLLSDRKVIFLTSIDSTNTHATKLAENDSPHGTLIIADSQTKGRGRLGRDWFSPPKKNIYMSIILRPEIKAEEATLLTIMAGVASARALRNTTGLEVKLKWPNDIVVIEKKLGGILIETKTNHDRLLFAVIGIGINVNMAAEDFPSGLRSFSTSVKIDLGKSIPRHPIIAEIFKETEQWYKVMLRGDRNTLLDEWRKLSSTLGRDVKITIGKMAFKGIAEDIDNKGMLILRLLSGGIKKISTGDVITLR